MAVLLSLEIFGNSLREKDISITENSNRPLIANPQSRGIDTDSDNGIDIDKEMASAKKTVSNDN